MGKLKDISGQKFGRLTALDYERIRVKNGTKIVWHCECDCGNMYHTKTSSLIRGDTKSCGCLNSERSEWVHTRKHGKSKTPEYRTWRAMLQRCYSEKASGYKYYGGKGVSVCDNWHDFETFMRDMGTRPEGTSIDRIDCNGDYQPDNCRWATAIEQANNRLDRSPLIPA